MPAEREGSIRDLASRGTPEAAAAIRSHLPEEPIVELQVLCLSGLSAMQEGADPKGLLYTLDSPNAPVRAAACTLYAGHPCEDASEALLGLARSDEDSLVRGLAIRALAASRPKETLALIVEQIRSTDAVSTCASVEALASFPPETAEPILLQAAVHTSRSVREAAIRGLFRDDSEAATSALIAALADNALEVRFAARMGLEERTFVLSHVPAQASKAEYAAVRETYSRWFDAHGKSTKSERFEESVSSILDSWDVHKGHSEESLLQSLRDARRLVPLWRQAGFKREVLLRVACNHLPFRWSTKLVNEQSDALWDLITDNGRALGPRE